jgi:hypothetical protein
MSSTIQEIQKSLVEGNRSLDQLLRQTKAVATKLSLVEVQQWVDLELRGFAPDADLPTYRKVSCDRLEIYNSDRDLWQFAGDLNYAVEARQPIAEIESFSRKEHTEFPVAKNFSIKNKFGDSFGSDWPQRFVVLGSEFRRVLEAVAQRWSGELEDRGIRIVDAEKFEKFWKGL